MAIAMRFLFCTFLGCAALFAQDFSGIKVEKVAEGFGFTEGPVWVRDGYLLFSDIPNNKILKYTPGKGVEVYREGSNRANGNAMDAEGRLYTCEGETRRITRTDKKGAVVTLADKWEGKRFNSPNDIAVRKDGHVFFTDPSFGSTEDTRELDFYGLFHITPKGEVELAAKYKTRPNGVTFSPDGKTLYVDNTDDRTVLAYDVDRNGKLSGERTLISNIEGNPDGLRTDEKGNLYITAKFVSIYSPEGKLLKNIDFPEVPANCAFGDTDLKSLYVTARTSVYRVHLPVKGALPY